MVKTKSAPTSRAFAQQKLAKLHARFDEGGLPRLRSTLPRGLSRFATVGAIGTGVHYAILWSLVNAGVPVLLASTIGAIGGALVNYVLNYRYTFKSNLAHRSTLVKFFTVALIGLLFNTLIMALLTRLHYFIAQIIATFFVLLWNYLANRLWTFRTRGNDHE